MALEMFVNGEKKKSDKKGGETLRFKLELELPTDAFSNEFSYVQLVKDKEKKKQEAAADSSAIFNPLDPESVEQLAAIARKLEEKYAPKKRKRVLHQSDLIDRGHGYDVNDTFVDDSEMYEDFVPHQLDTEFGGFYINTGNLEFKPCHEESSDFVLEKKKTQKPKLKKQLSHQTPQAILASQKLKKAKQHVAQQKVPKTTAKKALFAAASNYVGSPLVNSNMKPPAAKRPRKQQEPKHNAKLLKAAAITKPKVSLPTSTTNQVSLPAASIPISIGNISVSVPFFDSKHSSVGTLTSLASAPTSSSSATLLDSLASVDSTQGPDKEMVDGGHVAPPISTVPKIPPTLPDKLPDNVQTVVMQVVELINKDLNADGKISVKTRGSYDEQLVEQPITVH